MNLHIVELEIVRLVIRSFAPKNKVKLIQQLY